MTTAFPLCVMPPFFVLDSGSPSLFTDQFRLTSWRGQGVILFAFDGILGSDSDLAVFDAIEKLVSNSFDNKVILDFGDLRYLSPRAGSRLVDIRTLVEENKGKVVCLTPKDEGVQTLFGFFRLFSHLPFETNLDDALERVRLP